MTAFSKFCTICAIALSQVAGANLKMEIKQTNANIDVNPILNFSEIQFFYNGVLMTVPTSQFACITSSGGYLAAKCNDGVTATGSGANINMCKTGNDQPEQKIVVTIGQIPFNSITIYNAYGFNNPGGYDVGLRADGATIKIINADTDAVLFTNTFSGGNQPTWDFDYPSLTANPSAAPTTTAPVSRAPTRAPTAAWLPVGVKVRPPTGAVPEKVVDLDDQPWVPPTTVAEKSEKAADVDDQPWVPPTAAGEKLRVASKQ